MDTLWLKRQASSGRRKTYHSVRLVLLFLIGVAAQGAHAVNLNGIDFSALPGGKLELRMDFDGTPPQPKGYTIEQPARIALDLEGVSSQLDKKRH